MKIGFDAKRLFFNQRGLGSYSRNLLQGLIRFYPLHQYYFYTPKSKGFNSFREEYRRHHNIFLKTPSTLVPAFLSSLWRSYGIGLQVKSDQLDLYHGLSQELPLFFPGSVKSLVTIHDLIFLKYPRFFSAIDRNIYFNKISYACKKADGIIAISHATKEDLLTRLPIPENKISVVYQGCDEVFSRPQLPADIALPAPLPKKYILYVGALVPHKNAMALLKAFGKMTQIDHDLVIVGSGKKYLQKMKAFITEKGLKDRVHFLSKLGPLTNHQMALLYRQASLFVLPSLIEGFGIPIIEAMFSKTPVIVNCQAGMSEAAGDAAYKLDVNDSSAFALAMDRIINDHSLRTKMVASGELHVQKFRQEVVTAQMMSCYQKLVGGSSL